MARKNGRAKGSAFERRVASDLRLWLGDEWRVQRNLDDDQSGVRGRAGDILVDGGPHDWPFCIECKAGHGLRVSHLLKDTGPLTRQWGQAWRQADAVGLIPMLITKPQEHGSPALVVVPHWVRHRLGLTPPYAELTLGSHPVSAAKWDDLLQQSPLVVAEVAAEHTDHKALIAEVSETMGSPDMMRTQHVWVHLGEE